MEVKKSKKADLENKRGTWFLVGFIAILACMFITLEWSRYDVKVLGAYRGGEDIFVQELVPITFPEKPEPPPVPKQDVAEILTVIEDISEVPESDIQSSETSESDAVDVVYLPQPIIEDVEEPETDFIIVEEMPSFPGGNAELMRFLGKNLKYHPIPQETGVQGRVTVQFVVDKEGNIINPAIVGSLDPYLDKEALRVVSLMPKWKPGYQRGKAVRVKYTVPIVFRLN